MDIQKLTKKNQEFIHIATNQLIKDGKSDQEIKDILGDIIPELIENQKKESLAEDSLVLQLFGQLVSLLKSTNNLKLENLSKEIPETEYDNLLELARQVLQISKNEMILTK